MENVVRLFLQNVNLMHGICQVGVARCGALHELGRSLTNQFDLLLEILKKLLITGKQIHVRTSIFSHDQDR